jgi:hypothetical protein
MKQERIIFLVILISFTTLTGAQDDHYWSQQYGAESTLLGGAMVAGASNNSAVYYNPGALAFINNPSLSINANVYRMDRVLIKDGGGKGINLNSAQLSVFPQIISGMINLIKSGKLKLSYTLLTRNHTNLLINARYTSTASISDPDNPVPSSTNFVGAYDYANQLNEQWFGVGAGYRLSDKLGLGMTFFSSYRGQSYQLTNYVREINYENSNYIFNNQTIDEAIKYNTLRLIAKFGLSYNSAPFKFGLTVTTPSVGQYGKGEIRRENSTIVVSEDPDDLADNFMIMDKKSGMKASYKHPLSIAFGMDYQSVKTRLAVSAEYFFKIPEYHILESDSDPFLYPPSYIDSVNIKPLINSYLHVENAAKQVFNVGIGFSHTLYKQLNLLLGASTDFSSYSKPTEVNELLHGFGGEKIYHFSMGFSYNKVKNDICIGFSYAFTPSGNVPPYTVINQTPVVGSSALLSAKSYSIIVGYTYYFARNE